MRCSLVSHHCLNCHCWHFISSKPSEIVTKWTFVTQNDSILNQSTLSWVMAFTRRSSRGKTLMEKKLRTAVLLWEWNWGCLINSILHCWYADTYADIFVAMKTYFIVYRENDIRTQWINTLHQLVVRHYTFDILYPQRYVFLCYFASTEGVKE